MKINLIFLLLLISVAQAKTGIGMEAIINSRDTKVDTDGDGKIDYERTFGKNGKIIAARIDSDRNGSMDRFISFMEDGDVQIEKIDSNGDGKYEKEIQSQFLFGKLAAQTIEEDQNHDQVAELRIEKTYSYTLGKIFILTEKGAQWKYSSEPIIPVNRAP